jgi:Flp pilus assembly protein TadB
MSDKKRYGDPRKNQAREESKQARRRSKRELSTGFIFFAWAVFFVLWLAAGSLVIAAVVFGVLLSAGMFVLNAN